jgi:rhamnosyltransferase
MAEDDMRFEYNGASVFNVKVPYIGPARAVACDLIALRRCIHYCKVHPQIKNPVFYVLACRIGPFIAQYRREIHALGGVLYVNPDGHEWKRAKWSKPIRRYWKYSEGLMVRNADLLICDSKNIEKYIRTIYKTYSPKTTFIAYGSEYEPSPLADDAPAFTDWLSRRGLKAKNYYLVVGRFVPENNFETMIREFMRSDSQKDFAIITTTNGRFYNRLQETLSFEKDPRIKFVGTVYDPALLGKIRENAYAYFHGHEVGGTNPSLLEALGATDLNLLLNVGFNKEVAEDAALYWSKEEGNLAELIHKADGLSAEEIAEFGRKAKERIRKNYSWEYIVDLYETLFLK